MFKFSKLYFLVLRGRDARMCCLSLTHIQHLSTAESNNPFCVINLILQLSD